MHQNGIAVVSLTQEPKLQHRYPRQRVFATVCYTGTPNASS